MIKTGEAKSEADLAWKLGISRVRVNQIVSLLKLDNKIIEVIERLGDPLFCRIVSERKLRQYINKPLKDQREILNLLHNHNNYN